MTKKLSIIVPCYCEEESIPLFYDAVEKVAPQLPDIELEYWFIDDGSSDNTLGELRKLQQKDSEHVHYASFSRNFGKEAGLYCGLQQATGDYVAVMDVDLQDPPELLPKMLGYLESGEYDCVGTRRVDRKGEPPIRSFFAHMFYKLINKIFFTLFLFIRQIEVATKCFLLLKAFSILKASVLSFGFPKKLLKTFRL